MKYRKYTAFALALAISLSASANAFASVLGTEVKTYTADVTPTTNYHNNTYESETHNQEEYYVEYTPSKDVIPVVVNGAAIYGKRTIKQANDYLKKNNLRSLMGINADYFSFQTGVPMGHTIINGELVTNDSTAQNAIGFRKDGTAFIKSLQIQSELKAENGNKMIVDCINKWCQPTISTSYLLTNDFGSTTKTSGNCKFIIFSKVDGELAIGKKLELKVDEIFDYEGDIAIPSGKYVLVMTNTYGEQTRLGFMQSLQIGETVTLTNTAIENEELWETAYNGLGCVGDVLIQNGKLGSGFAGGTAPRTAVGIKENGEIIFYVIDGRQFSSLGVTLTTLAKRLQELGCVDAINLDGGGSSAIGGKLVGENAFSIFNSPSEGSLRSCANYIFLEDFRTPTGNGRYYYYDNDTTNRNFLKGYTEEIKLTRVIDDGGYDVDLSKATYTLENGETSNIELIGTTTSLNGTGLGYVVVHVGEGFNYLPYDIYENPDSISASAYKLPINELSYCVDDDFGTEITANAYVNGVELHSNASCFTWSCDESIGAIDQNGYFKPNTDTEKIGNVYISAGTTTFTLPIRIEKRAIFSDTSKHWSREFAEALYDSGVVTGENTEKGLIFRPDSNITRGEFAALIARYTGLDTLGSKIPSFADISVIPEWQLPYIETVSSNKLMNGKTTSNGLSFCSSDLLTRAEAITIIGRILKNTDYDEEIEVSDFDLVPDYAKEAVQMLLYLGIISGYDDGTIRPNSNITRAECAKLIANCD